MAQNKIKKKNGAGDSLHSPIYVLFIACVQGSASDGKKRANHS